MRRFLILFILFFLVACSGQSKEELLQEGNGLRDQGNLRGAIVLYKSALEKDANFLEARKELAEAYLISGNFAKAENEFKKVLHQNPSDSGLMIKLATIYIQQGKPEAALLELDNYHSANTETSESLTVNGRAFGALGDLASAEKLFRKALVVDPDALPPRMNLAKVFLQKDDLNVAREFLEEILALDDAHIAALYLLASLEIREGNRAAAISVYQRLVDANPKELNAFYTLGLLQMDMGNLDVAQQTVTKILSAFSGRPEGTRLQGMLLYRQGKYEDAIHAFSSSLKTQQHLLAYFFMGLSYYGLEQYELALNQFQKSLDLNPDFERARILVAMTLLKQKRDADAVIEIQKVLRANPNNAYAHNILGSAYLAQGEYDKGMTELETATELDPNLADAHLKRGIFHLAKGDGAQGESALVKAVAAAPEVLNSRLMLVTHYLRQKNYSAAIETLQNGMDGSATDALLNNYLAAAYFSQKKNQLAVDALNQAKKANPDYLTPYFNLASYYASDSKYDKAIAEYRAVLSRDAKNIKALLGMVAVYGVRGEDAEVANLFKQLEMTGTERGITAAVVYQLKQRQPVEALAIVNRGLEKFPASVDLLEIKGGLQRQRDEIAAAEETYIKLSGIDAQRGNRLLVGLYMQTNQAQKVAPLIDAALQADPQKDYPYLLSAGFLLAQKQSAEAVEVLQKGIKAVKNPLRLQMRLASVFELTEDSIQAESIYQRIIDNTPRFAPAYTALGFLKERAGDKGQALELYRKAIKYDRKNVAALNNAAYLLVDNFGRVKESLELAMSAYRLKPSDPRIMDTLGYVLLKNKRAEDAVNLLEKATKLLPKIAAIKLHLAQAKIELGGKTDAKELLQQVVASGNKQEVEQANNLLKSL